MCQGSGTEHTDRFALLLKSSPLIFWEAGYEENVGRIRVSCMCQDTHPPAASEWDRDLSFTPSLLVGFHYHAKSLVPHKVLLHARPLWMHGNKK